MDTTDTLSLWDDGLFKHVQVLDAELSILETLAQPLEQWYHTVGEVCALFQRVSASGILARKCGEKEENEELRRKRLSTDLFLLLQHSLQSGPLKGAKPGYFKRCGVKVVEYVRTEFYPKMLGFTPNTAPENVDFNAVCAPFAFTENQKKVLAKWYKNVAKAAAKLEGKDALESDK